jgi:hypothetical protein
MELREDHLRQTFARIIAEKSTNWHPDTPMATAEPARVGVCGWPAAPSPDTVRPLWTFYLAAADAIIADVRRLGPDAIFCGRNL